MKSAPCFCKIYQMGHMSRSSCFYNSAVKCTRLPSTGYNPSSIPSQRAAPPLILRLGQVSLGETVTACLKCQTSQSPIQNKVDSNLLPNLFVFFYLPTDVAVQKKKETSAQDNRVVSPVKIKRTLLRSTGTSCIGYILH